MGIFLGVKLTHDRTIERLCIGISRAGSRLPRFGGAQVGEGSRGPPRPLVGPGQRPGRGFRGRSPRRKTIYSVLEWLGRLSLALFCKKIILTFCYLCQFSVIGMLKRKKARKKEMQIGQVGMTSLQVNCSLTEVNASVFIAVF